MAVSQEVPERNVFRGRHGWFLDRLSIPRVEHAIWCDPKINPITFYNQSGNEDLNDIYYIKKLMYFAKLDSSDIIRKSDLHHYHNAKIYISFSKDENKKVKVLFKDYYSRVTFRSRVQDNSYSYSCSTMYFTSSFIFEILKMQIRVFYMGYNLYKCPGRSSRLLSESFLNLYYQLIS
jgi:hypothetical protein